MASNKREYMVLSGEGTEGTWERTPPLTDLGITRRLTRERCGGDRWARAFYHPENDHPKKWVDFENGEARFIHG